MKYIKMNNKGFATSFILFGLLILFLATTSVLIFTMNNSYTLSNTLKKNLLSSIEDASKELPLCKRATILHKEICNQIDETYYCSGAGYQEGETILYGNYGKGNILQSGDAFDCDVNGDGIYDSENERFYYITGKTINEENDTAILIYYNNTLLGNPNNTQLSLISYNSNNKNYLGPQTSINNLPEINGWKNKKIIYPNIRHITNEKNETINADENIIESFSYLNKAARLLTYQELVSACNINDNSISISKLDMCNYLLENTKYSDSNFGTYGYWLETSSYYDSNSNWSVDCYNRDIYLQDSNNSDNNGVRPVIEVNKKYIDKQVISPNKYILTLDPNGGILEEVNYEITYGDIYGVLPIPIKEGYIFKGWYTKQEEGIKINNNTRVSVMENQTLYALYE